MKRFGLTVVVASAVLAVASVPASAQCLWESTKVQELPKVCTSGHAYKIKFTQGSSGRAVPSADFVLDGVQCKAGGNTFQFVGVPTTLTSMIDARSVVKAAEIFIDLKWNAAEVTEFYVYMLEQVKEKGVANKK